jgi:UMF1 family MFS transporter
MMFDWAAQPFFTVVTTFIFGPYFISRMASDPATGQAAWGYGIAAGGLLIAVVTGLGSIADQTGPRKPWIAFFAMIKIAALCGLWFAAPGSNLVLVVAFTLAAVAAEFSIVFNDSMLLRLVPRPRSAGFPTSPGAWLSWRHDRADLHHRLSGSLSGNRQNTDRHRSLVRA